MRAERSTFGGAWARGAALAVLTLGLALAAASSAQAEWSQYRGSPERNARAVWDGAAGPTGTLDWQVEIGDGAMVDASPVVNPNTGIVYLGTTADSELAGTARLLAFYPNGHLQWAVRMWGYDVRAAPAVRRDSHLAVTGTRAVEVGDARRDGYWQFRQATFLVEPFRGTIKASPIARDGFLGTSPVVDTQANETYVFDRAYGGLSVYDWSFAQKPAVFFPPGDLEGGWGIDFPDLGTHFDKSAPAGPPRGDEPPVFERGPSPAWSATCDQVLWSTEYGVALKGKPWIGAGRIGEAPSLTTPVFGKAGLMYVVTRDDDGRAHLESYDQRAVRLWRSGPLGSGSASPPALGRGSAATGQPAMCSRVRDGVVNRVRDNRPETAYVAVGERLFAFRDDGSFQWERRPGGELGEPVVIQRGAEELLLVPTGGSSPRLAAYRPDGSQAWSFALDAPSLGSPAVANGRIYVATTSSLYAIR
jgi:outer membrane protein assembly factor BamB